MIDEAKMPKRLMHTENAANQSEQISRACRFPIQIPLKFRESGSREWHAGQSINISRTGILFKSDIDVLPKTLLEMQILLPAEAVGKKHVHVRCWGPVVRMAPLVPDSGVTASAAIILRYRFHNE